MDDIEGKTSFSDLVTMNIAGSDKYAMIMKPFTFRSKVLWDKVCKKTCTIPEKFVFDFESIPLFRGACPEAGAIHDYLCRTNSEPVVSKSTAAKVYLEFVEYIYAMNDKRVKLKQIHRAVDWLKKWGKFSAVWCWPGYYHKHRVEATYEEIAG